MTKEIEKQIADWQLIQGLSLDVLRTLTSDQLRFTVGRNMGMLGEQFRHMARVRFQYAEAIETRRLDKVAEKIDPAVATSKEDLLDLWGRANQKLLEALANINSEETIDWRYWGVDTMSIPDHLNALMDHETLHNGQIIVYLRTMELPFPKSWATWGL